MRRIAILAFVLLACVSVSPQVHAASSTPPPGGATQTDAVEGCMNEWLFDGIWRLKVDSVESLSDPSMPGMFGWGVLVEVRNGTTRSDYTPSYTGSQSFSLGFADDTTLDVDATTTGTLDAQKITYHTFPQAAAFKHELTFWYPSGTKQSEVSKPTKFLWIIDPKMQAQHVAEGQPGYTTKHPSFRVKLDCTK